ncbi:uncharacterized protein LOC127001302 isoform X3 [Eriocheir sinensis]|uniref:uncharacterized protein LOC127001302 isoform X3 n=1 Tax=Eriocheir sinensis TaxID=95602 RepID=UPI0021C8A7F9|nr:uncharacterized protein LOC127001302 isoform X3 [Eriocheir sinensis]
MDYTSSRCEASKLHGNSVRRSPQCPTPKVSLDSSVTPLPSMILGRLKIPLYSFLAMAARSASAIQHHLLSVSRPFTCCRGLLKMATLTLVLAGGVTLCTAEPSSSSENNPAPNGQSAFMEVAALALVMVLAATVPLVSWLMLVGVVVGFKRSLDAMLGEETAETLFGRRHFGGTLRLVEKMFRSVTH